MPQLLQRIVFVVLMAFLGFCAGMATGTQFVPEGSGLAGPAIAIWYGLGGLAIALIVAFILIRFSKKGLGNVLIVITLLSLIVVGWIIYRVSVLKAKQSENMNMPGTTQYQQKTNSGIFRYADFNQPEIQNQLGCGIAKPRLADNKVVNFYSFFHADKDASAMKPVDSIVIIKKKNHFEISYAPPWFFPGHMKLDYDILLLQVLTISRNWMEVIVNKQTGQTHWIAAADADFIEWSTFLLSVYSIEITDPGANPLRVKPLSYAGIIATSPLGLQLKPLAISGDWMMVSTAGFTNRIVPTGWIRWRKDDKLLLGYSLLS